MNNNIIVFLIISFILFFIFNTENIYNKKNIPIENFTTSNNAGFCSDGIGGKVFENISKEKCFSWSKNKKQYIRYDVKTKKYMLISEKNKKELIHKDGINKKEDFYGKNTYAKCKQWIDDPEKKDPSNECLQAIWDTNGCNYKKVTRNNFTKSHNFEHLYLDSQYYFAKGCIETGIKQEKSNNRIVNEEEDSNQDNNEAEVYLGTKDCSSQIILIDSLWENARDMLLNTNDSLFSKSEKKFLNENKNINLINIKNIFKKKFKCN